LTYPHSMSATDTRVAETGRLGAPISGESALDGDEAGAALGTGCIRVDALLADKTIRISSTGGGQEPPMRFLISSEPSLIGENKVGKSLAFGKSLAIISPFPFIFTIYLMRRLVSSLSNFARFSPKIFLLTSSVTGAKP